MDLNINITINKIVVGGDIDLIFKYSVNMEYNKFLEFYIPTIDSYLNTSGFILSISLNFFSLNLNIDKVPEDLINDVFDSGPNQSSKAIPRKSATNSSFENFCDLLSGMALTMTLLGVIISAYAGFLSFAKDETLIVFFYVISIFTVTISLGILIAQIFAEPENFSNNFILGMALGSYLTAAICYDTKDYLKRTGWYMANYVIGKETLKVLGVLDLVFGLIDLDMTYQEINMDEKGNLGKKLTLVIIALSTGIFSLFLARSSLIFLAVNNKYEKMRASKFFGKVSLFFTGLLFAILVWKMAES